MHFSIKNILTLWVLFFACSFLHAAEPTEADLAKYQFYEKDDCIKVKISLPAGIMPISTLYKINSPDSNGVAVQIKSSKAESLKDFYQLVSIEMYALPCPEEGGVIFEIIETLERKPTSKKIAQDKITSSSKYFVTTDNLVDFRNDILPKLTVSPSSPYIKYVRFFTKP